MEMYELPQGVATRWSSFENPLGEKGKGGLSNRGAKGRPFATVCAGETVELLNTQGPGRVCRIWATLSERNEQILQDLVIRCYWDDAKTPAVELPFGEFFGCSRTLTAFQNGLFSSPEGRSFNCFVPMPYQKGARITLSNEGTVTLGQLYYDVNFVEGSLPQENAGYFHAVTTRSVDFPLGQEVPVLPHVTGKGRYLGALFTVYTKPEYGKTWFGEGEVKVYLDGDKDFPTLCGTGTEDYIGTGYGQGVFANHSQGCFVSDTDIGKFIFYRYHLQDPVYFEEDISVTIQAMGGDNGGHLKTVIAEGANLIPVTIHDVNGIQCVYRQDVKEWPDDTWVNFFRCDDYTVTAYYYLNRP